jgi:hypothetical protein
MSDYIYNLIARSFNLTDVIEPRLASMYEQSGFAGDDVPSVASPAEIDGENIYAPEGKSNGPSHGRIRSAIWNPGADKRPTDMQQGLESPSSEPVQERVAPASMERLINTQQPGTRAVPEIEDLPQSLPSKASVIGSTENLTEIIQSRASLPAFNAAEQEKLGRQPLSAITHNRGHSISLPVLGATSDAKGSPEIPPTGTDIRTAIEDTTQSMPQRASRIGSPEDSPEVARPRVPLPAFNRAEQGEADQQSLPDAGQRRERFMLMPDLSGQVRGSGDVWRAEIASQKEGPYQPNATPEESSIGRALRPANASDRLGQKASDVRRPLSAGLVGSSVPPKPVSIRQAQPGRGLGRGVGGSPSFEAAIPNEPTINVTIGRIIVRAVTQPERQAQRTAQKPPILSLDDYLRARKGGA